MTQTTEPVEPMVQGMELPRCVQRQSLGHRAGHGEWVFNKIYSGSGFVEI